MRHLLLFCLLLTWLSGTAQAQSDRPSPAQLAWHETGFYLFIHFGPNTFTDEEWGHGTEPEDIFNPTQLDCAQWCRVAKAAGARGIIITAKHHDGFCLWPSKYSTHTVRESKWRNGEGDVLRELSEACRAQGLLLGFYLSPWDRNHPKYGTTEYNDVYVATMTELMTQYGPLFEFWWDGANGEGPNGKRQVYDFHRFEREAARLQPKAVIFSDIGPGCRWAGNERGTISETNWGTLDTVGFKRGEGAPPTDTLQQGNVYGPNWIPAECDVSIRPGWFYHAQEDEKVKSADQLWQIFMQSYGRGANLILNVPPDRRGRIHERDSVALVEFGALRKARLSYNLVATRGGMVGSQNPKNNAYELTDGDPRSFVTLPESAAKWATYFEWPAPMDVSYLMLQENIANGQRISGFVVEVKEKKGWREVARGTTVGYRRIVALDPKVLTQAIRVRILATKGGVPELSEVRVF
jgi:alpha-L-fucosidase